MARAAPTPALPRYSHTYHHSVVQAPDMPHSLAYLSNLPLTQNRYVPFLICRMPLIDTELYPPKLKIVKLSTGQLEAWPFDP